MAKIRTSPIWVGTLLALLALFLGALPNGGSPLAGSSKMEASSLLPVTRIGGAGDPSSLGGTYQSLGMALLNNNGQVAFSVASYAGCPANAIMLASNGVTTPLVTCGEASPTGGYFTGEQCTAKFPRYSLNDLGVVAFWSWVTNAYDPTTGNTCSPDRNGIYLAGGGFPTTKVAEAGDPAPGGGTFRGFGYPSINNSGAVAFDANCVYYANCLDWNIFISQAGSTAKVVGYGDKTFIHGAETSFAVVNNPVINSSGDVAFAGATGQLGSPLVGGLFVSHGGAITPVALGGDAAPGGSSFLSLQSYAFNNNGELAFTEYLANGTTGLFFVSAGGVVSQIAAFGSPAPGGGTFSWLDTGFFSLTLNNQSVISFAARVLNPDGTTTYGLFLAQGSSVSLALVGGQDTTAGALSNCIQEGAINDREQLVFYGYTYCAIPNVVIYVADVSGALSPPVDAGSSTLSVSPSAPPVGCPGAATVTARLVTDDLGDPYTGSATVALASSRGSVDTIGGSPATTNNGAATFSVCSLTVGTAELTANVSSLGTTFQLKASVTFTFSGPMFYIATGDSVPAGADIGSSCATTSPPCTADPGNAYPAFLSGKLAQLDPFGVKTSNLSCSGTTSSQYRFSGLCGHGQSQLSLTTTTTEEPDVVTVTVGADDYSLKTLVSSCLTLLTKANLPGAGDCAEKVLNNEQQPLAALAGNLTVVLQSIAAAHPHALIVVTNYYNPLPLSISTSQCESSDIFSPPPTVFACNWFVGNFNRLLSATDALVTDLNLKIGTVVIQQFGPSAGRVLLADVHDKFNGHCTAIDLKVTFAFLAADHQLGCGSSTWIAAAPNYHFPPTKFWGVTLEVNEAGVHPTAAGHQCIANVIWETIKQKIGSTESPNTKPCG